MSIYSKALGILILVVVGLLVVLWLVPFGSPVYIVAATLVLIALAVATWCAWQEERHRQWHLGGLLVNRDCVYRIIILDNGGNEPRDLVGAPGEPPPLDMEADTGAWNPVPFYPPDEGSVYRRFLSFSGAKNRAAHLIRNGCTVQIERSQPVQW